MEHINIQELERFVSVPVAVAIQGENDEEKAPFVQKTIKKLGLCPDRTHLRIYFDDFYFFAVPITSSVVKTDTEWTGYDEDAGLYYVIKKENEFHD